MVKRLGNKMLNRSDALIRLGLVLVILVLANVVSHYAYFRWDLTAEKRYSISKPTKELVRKLNDVVIIKVYLGGELNAGFTRLKESTRNMLKEFQAYGGKNIEFEFIDPMAIENLEERKALITDLIQRGLAPTNLTTKSKTDTKQQLVFPGAMVVYGGREFPVNLLENQIGFSPQMVLNNSVILLEYKFANAIKKLTQYRPPRVGFIRGYGELNEAETTDIRQTLTILQYEVKDFDLVQNYYIPDRFDVIIIAKPQRAFDEKEKYKIDQYIMHGGKVLWLVDGTNATMDSLRVSYTGQFVQGTDYNLDDMLFKYGARINNDLVQDVNLNNPIPLVVGKMGNAPQTEMFPWYYFPLLVSDNNHAINKNLDPVAAFFASSIDTVKNPGVRKTILLHTSANAKAQLTPTRVHFGILQSKANPAYFNQPDIPVAVLLEGEFESVYKNRVSPEYLAASDTVEHLKFREKSPESRMIVIADGDVMRSEIRSDSTAYPLGYYLYTKQTFANKDFILNCIEYLADNNGLLETRNKEVKLRMLNSVKVEEEKLQWQLLNIALPIGLVMLFGLGYGFFRKRKYAA
ncbi:MAG: gliding motility-associated ABC transporter substrate-binding protein GldG [Chitinophagales bacterium]|nr:gliding motility-associated ABC transporter substrate-binding protein GldG [Chitinophagales bacterium]